MTPFLNLKCIATDNTARITNATERKYDTVVNDDENEIEEQKRQSIQA
jgi:hypothetical protein